MDGSGTPRRSPRIALAALVVVLVVVALAVTSAPRRPTDAGTHSEMTPGPSAAARMTTTPSRSSDSPAPSVPAGSEAAGSAAPSATLPADPVVLVAGDIASCATDGDEATAALLDGLDGTIITAGDNVYPRATRRTLERCFDPSWGRHKDRIRPAAGNHDWDGGLDAYLAYFGAAAVNEDGDPWYTWQEGSWQVIVLDSDCDEVEGCDRDSRQGQWLAETLATSQARCTLAVFHHPRFTSGEHGSSDRVAEFWELLYADGAEIVVSGHDHDYERFAPQDPAGRADAATGIRQFVAGTGGISLRTFGAVEANSEVRSETAHGVLALTLRDGSYDWLFHSVGGRFRDEGSTDCH